jgi:hypothetical protein
LRGLNFVLGILRIPLARWPGHFLSVPIGLELYLKPAQAPMLDVPYRSRSQLARAILDFVAAQVPGRSIRSLADGSYATKDYARQLPAVVQVGGRLPISAQLYEVPPHLTTKRRGAPRTKGHVIGSPKTLAQTTAGWASHPTEAGAEIQAWDGLWHSVLPGRLIRVVVLRRDPNRCSLKAGQRTPPPPVEAVFTTDLTLSAHDILHEYADRWAVEICQSQPVKMTWSPLRLLIATIIYLRGLVKREDIGDVDLLPGNDDFFDQTLCDRLALFERQPLQVIPQQVAKVVNMLDDLLPVERLGAGAS